MPNSCRFLTEAEFSEQFRISRRTLQRWRETGEGPVFVRLGARRLAYPLADALLWAAGRTYGSRASEMASAVKTRS